MATTDSTTGHRQRLRERFLAGEPRALTEEALAELLLTFAIPPPRRSTPRASPGPTGASSRSAGATSARAFAFILHSEFPRPGMYDVSLVEHGPAFQAMLWRPDALVHALYELRNRGWIAKVSEIDSVRQFTTLYDLEGLVDRTTAETKEAAP